MSVNYDNIHQVDVPVTDLDDDDDDIVVSGVANGLSETHREQINDMIDDLDYELEPNNSDNKSVFKKIAAAIKPKRNNSASYEMVTNESGESDSDSMVLNGDDDEPFRLDFKDYKIRLLHRNLRRVIFIGTTVCLVLFGLVIYFSRGSSSIGAEGKVNEKVILTNSTHNFYPTTIIISLDGFHPHYISPHNTPSMHSMLLEDYGAPYMIPSFPSSTFPNHWTLVTGLYPSEHGIVGNTFYDPKLKKQFVNTNPKVGGLDADFWQGGEPIWQTAYKQGVNSAVHMWPGSEVEGVGIGTGPLFVDKYNGSELLSSKVDRVMGWLDIEDIEQRPELILTYVPTIDQYGHKYGISGQNLTDALKYVDDFVALLQKELKSRHLNDVVNLIIVSDHGMAPTSNDRLLYLDDLIDLKKIEHIDGWPLFGLRPYGKYSVNDIYKELLGNLAKLGSDVRENFDIYKVEDIPKEWDFGGALNNHRFNYRLAPIWVIPKVGYSITTHKNMEENNYDYSPKGVHGYNNTELLMRAIFLGSGPYFDKKLKSGKKVMPFKNTEVYNILCDSLNLSPSDNNGSSVSVNSIIGDNNALPDDWIDSLTYPNLPYEVEYLVKNSTYDYLWKKLPISDRPLTVTVSTNDRPYDSLVSEESTISMLSTEKLPKPTDFQNNDHDDNDTDKENDGNNNDNSGSKPDDSKHGFGKIIHHIGENLDNVAEGLENAVENVGDTIEDTIENILDDIND